MGGTILLVSDLTCTVRGKSVLDGLSLRLETGRIYALLGEAGSGKTTLLRCLAGLIPAEGGSAEIGGIPPLTASEQECDGYSHRLTYSLRPVEAVIIEFPR